jgi:Ca-activated chloride channel family protein
MTFLAPWAAWFLAGIPLIVLLYLLKLKREPVQVSTLIFWQRILQENRRRAFFQRLRNLISLLLHLLIFLLILGALAKPTLGHWIGSGTSTVIILDTRARMQARESGNETRFEKARRWVRSTARQAQAKTPIALITVGAADTVAVPFSSEATPIEELLERLEPSDAEGDLKRAVELAHTLLNTRRGQHRMILVTDAPQPALSRLYPDLKVLSVGTPQDNVAITRLATRPLLNSAQTSEVLIELRNFGQTPVSGTLELTLDGRLLDAKPVELKSGERKLDVFPAVPGNPLRSARGWLKARIDVADALALDNAAYALLPQPHPHRVLLVSKANWFLEKLLAADPRVTFDLLTPEAFTLSMASKFDAVILDQVLPATFQMGATAGNFFFLKDTPFNQSAPVLERPLITETQPDHPALRLVNLQNIAIVRATPLKLPEATPEGWTFEMPIRALEHPLFVTGTHKTATGNQRMAALAFDPAESDLPLHIAFPLLMANTIHWLAGEQPVVPLSIRAGQTLALGPEQRLWPEPLTPPEKPLPPAEGPWVQTFFQPQKQGYYLISQHGQRPAWLAVNTFSEAESDLRNAAPAEPATALRSAGFSFSALAERPLWQGLALAALLLSVTEWALFHRRRTE